MESTNSIVKNAIVANRAMINADNPFRFTSAEISALQGAAAGMKGAKFSQVPGSRSEKFFIDGPGGTRICINKYKIDGFPVQFDVRGNGPRTGLTGKIVTTIREAITVVKRMITAAKKQQPYSFGMSDFYD